MIKYAIVILFSIGMLQAQTNEPNNQVHIGDIFQIGRPVANEFRYINFPSADFIIKKGGNANYKKVEGNNVVVTSVKERKDGSTQIKIKRTDGEQFFDVQTQVSVDYIDAMETGELLSK